MHWVQQAVEKVNIIKWLVSVNIALKQTNMNKKLQFIFKSRPFLIWHGILYGILYTVKYAQKAVPG